MPTGVKFPGQVLSVWLERENDRKRLVRVLQTKYKGQLGFSSYGKLAIYKMLDEDEATITTPRRNENERGRGAGCKPNAPQAEDVENAVSIRIDDTQHKAEEGSVCNDR